MWTTGNPFLAILCGNGILKLIQVKHTCFAYGIHMCCIVDNKLYTLHRSFDIRWTFYAYLSPVFIWKTWVERLKLTLVCTSVQLLHYDPASKSKVGFLGVKNPGCLILKSWSHNRVLVLKLLQTFLYPRDVAWDLGIKSWVHPAPVEESSLVCCLVNLCHPPFSTADYPNKMVAPTMFAHKGTSRILLTKKWRPITNLSTSTICHLTGVDFSTGAEFSRLGDISSIERVALASPYAPNLLKQKPENNKYIGCVCRVCRLFWQLQKWWLRDLNLSCPDGGGVAACVVVLLEDWKLFRRSHQTCIPHPAISQWFPLNVDILLDFLGRHAGATYDENSTTLPLRGLKSRFDEVN